MEALKPQGEEFFADSFYRILRTQEIRQERREKIESIKTTFSGILADPNLAVRRFPPIPEQYQQYRNFFKEGDYYVRESNFVRIERSDGYLLGFARLYDSLDVNREGKVMVVGYRLDYYSSAEETARIGDDPEISPLFVRKEEDKPEVFGLEGIPLNAEQLIEASSFADSFAEAIKGSGSMTVEDGDGLLTWQLSIPPYFQPLG